MFCVELTLFKKDNNLINPKNVCFLLFSRQETIEKLFSVIFDDVDHPNSDSSIVNGINTILSMIEIRRSTNEGMEELITPMDVERVAQGLYFSCI